MQKFTSVLRAQALSVGAIFLFGACSPVPSKKLNPEQKKADMEWMFSQFDENYAPLQYKLRSHGSEYLNVYNTMKKHYRELAAATDKNDDFYHVMHQFIAEFHDPHTTASLSHGGLKKRAKIAYLGFTGKRKGNNLVVTDFLPTYNVSASHYPIQLGDEISSMDGESLDSLIRKDLVKYEDIGHDAANLTFHMNKLFNRYSLELPVPRKRQATLTIVKRAYTAEEKIAIEEREERKVHSDEKKDVQLTVKLPWIQKDVYDFRKEQRAALGLSSVAPDDGEASDADDSEDSNADMPIGRAITSSIGDLFQEFGFRGFDGEMKSPFKLLSKMERGSQGYHFLKTFYFPRQIESISNPQVNQGGVMLSVDSDVYTQLISTRYVPQGARYVYIQSPEDPVEVVYPTYPTFVTEEGPNKTKVATIFLNTFSPEAAEGEVMDQFNKTLETLQFWGVENIQIDLINNGGGSLSLGMKLAQALSNTKVVMPSMQFVISQTWLDEFEKLSDSAPTDTEKKLASDVLKNLKSDMKKGMRLSRPMSAETLIPFELAPNIKLKKKFNITLLVNEMCASMCDIFTGIMQDNQLAKVIGTKTMGAGGNVVAHYSAPNSHLILRQTESLIIRSNGQFIENNGIEPDVAFNINENSSRKYKNVYRFGMEQLLPQPAVQMAALRAPSSKKKSSKSKKRRDHSDDEGESDKRQRHDDHDVNG